MDSDRLDQIATTLDDIATTLEEIKEGGVVASADVLEKIRQSIEKATSAIDRLENREAWPSR
jgi:methyl-accepting chemotaxis protein